MFTIKTDINQFKTKTGKKSKKYKVLLNAGGGCFGYIITYLMSHLEEDIYKKIDVAAGTSIGGILTLLYAVNSDYKWINQLFEIGCPKIFNKRIFGGISGPYYDNKELSNFIDNIVCTYKLSDINRINNKDLHIIIPTLDYTLTQPRVFDNINLNPKLDMELKTIALATSAAPTYFPAIEYIWKLMDDNPEDALQRPINEQIYMLTQQALIYQEEQKKNISEIIAGRKSVLIDGGVLENIPVVTTYTTLRSKLGIEAKDIDMFVIGTGDDYTSNKCTVNQMNKWNLIDWLTKFLIPYVTESNELMSVYWGSLFGFNSFCYYNPLKVSGDLDDAKILPTLKKQCDTIVEDFKSEIYKFLEK